MYNGKKIVTINLIKSPLLRPDEFYICINIFKEVWMRGIPGTAYTNKLLLPIPDRIMSQGKDKQAYLILCYLNTHLDPRLHIMDAEKLINECLDIIFNNEEFYYEDKHYNLRKISDSNMIVRNGCSYELTR